MHESDVIIQGMAYVPGVVSGVLRSDTSEPGSIAMVGEKEALEPITRPAAFVIVDGTPLSHAMIGLMAQGIPTVLINNAQSRLLKPGIQIWVDGTTGRIATNQLGMPVSAQNPIAPEAGHPVCLIDHTKVWLMASVRSVNQAQQALDNGASSIGLVRSEFFGADRLQPPDIGFFTEVFEKLCASAGQLVVTLRLIDLATDKPPRWLPQAEQRLHPFGMQGARLFQQEPIHHVLRDQLAVIADLHDRFAVEVLIPFISHREELLHWVSYVRESLPKTIPVGAMAETPAAVMELPNWIDLVDFLAVGTNDLMQCLFGADRDEPSLHPYLDPYRPVLYRLLNQLTETTTGRYLDRIRLCGVVPRLAGVLPVLVGLGYRRFSVDPVWIPYLAETLASYKKADAEDLARQVCACRDSREVFEVLGLNHGVANWLPFNH